MELPLNRVVHVCKWLRFTSTSFSAASSSLSFTSASAKSFSKACARFLARILFSCNKPPQEIVDTIQRVLLCEGLLSNKREDLRDTAANIALLTYMRWHSAPTWIIVLQSERTIPTIQSVSRSSGLCVYVSIALCAIYPSVSQVSQSHSVTQSLSLVIERVPPSVSKSSRDPHLFPV